MYGLCLWQLKPHFLFFCLLKILFSYSKTFDHCLSNYCSYLPGNWTICGNVSRGEALKWTGTWHVSVSCVEASARVPWGSEEARHLLCGGVRYGIREVIELLERFVDGVLVQVEAAQRVHDTEATTSEHARTHAWTNARRRAGKTHNTLANINILGEPC